MFGQGLSEQKIFPPPHSQVIRMIIRKESFPELYLNAEISSVINRAGLTLLVPEVRSVMPIEEGDPLFIEYPLCDALYEATCIVERIEEKSSQDGQSTALHVNSTSNLKRVQRRDMYRLPVSIPVSFRMVSFPQAVEISTCFDELINDTSNPKDKAPVFTGEIKNISGTGLCIAAETSLTKGDQIIMKFCLHDVLQTLAARVVWSTPPQNKRESLGRAGAQFQNIGLKEQNQISRFIFEEQRHKLQHKIT